MTKTRQIPKYLPQNKNSNQGHFELTIKDNGSGKVVKVATKASDTIDNIKQKIHDKHQTIAVDAIRLGWNGKPLLEGFRPLAEHEIDIAEIKTMRMVPPQKFKLN